MTRARRAGAPACAGILLVITCGACSLRAAVTAPSVSTTSEHVLVVHGARVTMHVARAPTRPAAPLIVYFTGDGGWARGDVDLFDHLVLWGYAAIGISAPEYLDGLDTREHQISVADLAMEMAQIVSGARQWLTFPDRRVILVGVSRGADLVIAAAGDEPLRSQLAGVVAIGLTPEEEYVKAPPGSSRSDMIDLYEHVPSVGTIPIAVVQSTHDEYITAADARTHFGPDGSDRLLLPVEAADHGFSDARETMYASVLISLSWLNTRLYP